MSINHVQFQKGLSMAEFFERYGSEGQCHAALVALVAPFAPEGKKGRVDVPGSGVSPSLCGKARRA